MSENPRNNEEIDNERDNEGQSERRSSGRGDRGGRSDRGDRGDRGGRSDRGDRGDREDRGDRGDRGDRNDRGARGRGRRRRGKSYYCPKGKCFDYKDLDTLFRYTSESGKIKPRRQTGNCSRCQRELAREIKRARHLALLSFVDAD